MITSCTLIMTFLGVASVIGLFYGLKAQPCKKSKLTDID